MYFHPSGFIVKFMDDTVVLQMQEDQEDDCGLQEREAEEPSHPSWDICNPGGETTQLQVPRHPYL